MMKRTTVIFIVIAFYVVGSVYADYAVKDHGAWPKNWPAELEPLRAQSRTLEGPLVPQLHYEIPFAKRADFEAAWPHLLTVKSKGAPVILLRGPHQWLGDTMSAGVRIHCPPAGTDERANPPEPLPGQRGARQRWMWANYIELVVDGNVVDLNRIPLPADTLIIDERFTDRNENALNRGTK